MVSVDARRSEATAQAPSGAMTRSEPQMRRSDSSTAGRRPGGTKTPRRSPASGATQSMVLPLGSSTPLSESRRRWTTRPPNSSVT